MNEKNEPKYAKGKYKINVFYENNRYDERKSRAKQLDRIYREYRGL